MSRRLHRHSRPSKISPAAYIVSEQERAAQREYSRQHNLWERIGVTRTVVRIDALMTRRWADACLTPTAGTDTVSGMPSFPRYLSDGWTSDSRGIVYCLTCGTTVDLHTDTAYGLACPPVFAREEEAYLQEARDRELGVAV